MEFKITRVMGGHFPGMKCLIYFLLNVSLRQTCFFVSRTKHDPWKCIACDFYVQPIKL